MMLLCGLLLALGLTLVETSKAPAVWTYNVLCHDCAVINTFRCNRVRTCDYEVRRCLTISIRLNPRELLIYKNCTSNCTFVYEAHMSPPAPKHLRTNSFYWVHCCGSIRCNEGGPNNIERDILPDETIEEELEEGTRVEGPGFFLSLASVLLVRTLT